MRAFFLLMALLGSSHAALRPALSWTPSSYPNPMKDIGRCGRGRQSWICDPDGILSTESANVVEGVLKKIYDGDVPYKTAPCGSSLEGSQVAVALMQRMQSPDAATAERFARQLHDAWGVGNAACDNGVLLLLATKDRQVYISVGKGATDRLTFDVLGNIIERMKPNLRDKRFDEAVEGAVVDIGLALAGKAVGGGGGGWDDAIGFLIFAGVAGGLVFWSARGEARKRRRYQDCKSKLEKLKRDQAALRNHSYNPTSCPVCLEDFEDANGSGSGAGGAGGSGADGKEGSSSDAAPSASAPLKPSDLETEEELKRPLNPQPQPTAPPLITGQQAGGAAAAAAAQGEGAQGQQGQGQGRPPRRPLVLPCGHAFCEFCITQWLEQKKVTCPICRRPIDEDDAPDTAAGPNRPSNRPPTASPNDPTANNRDGAAGPSTSSGGPPRACTVDDEDLDAYGSSTSTMYGTNGMYGNGGMAGAGGIGMGAGAPGVVPRLRLRWGNRRRMRVHDDLLMAEMLFRLRQLQRLHPEYITEGMVQQWEVDVQNGREFSAQQLRDFQLRDPATRANLEASGRRGAGARFGGGSSRGGSGRGGSW